MSNPLPTSETSSLVYQVIRNTLSNYAGKFISLAAWILLTPFILTHLEPGRFGLWVLVGSLVSYGSLLSFGVTGAVTKFVAEYHTQRKTTELNSIIGTALTFYTALALVVGLASLVAATAFPLLFNIPSEDREVASWLVLLSGLGLALSIPCSTTQAILRGLHRFDIINVLGVIGTLATTGLTIVVLLLGGDVLSLAAVNIVVILVMQIRALRYVHQIAPEIRVGWSGASKQAIRRIASFSSSLFFIHLGGYLEVKTDEMVIGASMTVSAVTPYSLARTLSTLPQMLADQFLSLLLPLSSKLNAENNEQRLQELYFISTRLTLMVLLVTGIPLVILSARVLTAWVGIEYSDYANLVVILTAASLVDTSQWPASLILQGMGHHRFIAVLAVCSGVANIALSLLLVHPLGLVGVAVGTLIPMAVLRLSLTVAYTIRRISVRPRAILTRILVPAFAPVLPLILVTQLLNAGLPQTSWLPIPVAGSAGAVAYLIVYFNLPACAFERRIMRRLAQIPFEKASILHSGHQG